MQAKAHEQMGQLLPREKHKHAYDEALKERYKHLPEVKRILRHRHLPTEIYKVCLHACHVSSSVSMHLCLRVYTPTTAMRWFGCSLPRLTCCTALTAAHMFVWSPVHMKRYLWPADRFHCMHGYSAYLLLSWGEPITGLGISSFLLQERF